MRVGPTTLDFVDEESFQAEHYAFSVSDEELDAILTRVKEAGLSFYADPGHEHEGELNDWNGGRRFYFSDPTDDGAAHTSRVRLSGSARADDG